MKRTILGFVISALVLVTTALWILKDRAAWSAKEIIQAPIVLVVVGFALYLGISRLRSHQRHEPAQDELSKKIMMRASSIAYYVSIYLWLFVMYISDKTTLETHSLIGAGILGMAVIFLLSWIGVKMFGMKND